MIKAINLNKRFGKLQVLKGVNFEVGSNRIVAVLGPNGSGKTTIIKIILGMVIPEYGAIEINDQNILGSWEYRNKIGYLPQIAQFPDNLTVAELISLIRKIRNQPSNEDELINLFDLKSSLDKRLGTLSGGTRQKVNIVLTFMFDSPLLILDEPTAGLDPVSLIKLKNLIRTKKENGKTVLITTHIMPLVEELADEIIFLLEGSTYFHGSLEELKTKTNQLDLEHAIAKIVSQ
jgi:Cu-processing system ATP-binding protein